MCDLGDVHEPGPDQDRTCQGQPGGHWRGDQFLRGSDQLEDIGESTRVV